MAECVRDDGFYNGDVGTTQHGVNCLEWSRFTREDIALYFSEEQEHTDLIFKLEVSWDIALFPEQNFDDVGAKCRFVNCVSSALNNF